MTLPEASSDRGTSSVDPHVSLPSEYAVILHCVIRKEGTTMCGLRPLHIKLHQDNEYLDRLFCDKFRFYIGRSFSEVTNEVYEDHTYIFRRSVVRCPGRK